jgi:3-hydroxybutyryl-CoA dehydrogenase
MAIQTAAVIGTGMMGPGIATTLAIGGVPVTILSRSAESAGDAMRRANGFAELLAAHGLAQPGWAPITCSADVDSVVPEADLVIESAPENMEFKQALFAHLDAIAKPDAILASNTSGLSITAIASQCQRFPERVVTAHFWNPPHLMPLVEIVLGKQTSMAVAQELRELFLRCGKTPVIVKKDTPGQLGNRIQSALIRECVNILEQGIADVEDIDLAVKSGFGLRLPEYGVFEHADAVGLDLAMAVADYVTRDLSNRVGASDAMKERVARGDLGVKTGKGFYDWSKKDWNEVRARRDGFVLDVVKRRRAKATGQG